MNWIRPVPGNTSTIVAFHRMPSYLFYRKCRLINSNLSHFRKNPDKHEVNGIGASVDEITMVEPFFTTIFKAQQSHKLVTKLLCHTGGASGGARGYQIKWLVLE